MFKNITDPYTKKKYSTSSPEGKHILNQYINNYNSKGQKGGASGVLFKVDVFCVSVSAGLFTLWGDHNLHPAGYAVGIGIGFNQ